MIFLASTIFTYFFVAFFYRRNQLEQADYYHRLANIWLESGRRVEEALPSLTGTADIVTANANRCFEREDKARARAKNSHLWIFHLLAGK